jgi:hypothetical protein
MLPPVSNIGGYYQKEIEEDGRVSAIESVQPQTQYDPAHVINRRTGQTAMTASTTVTGGH